MSNKNKINFTNRNFGSGNSSQQSGSKPEQTSPEAAEEQSTSTNTDAEQSSAPLTAETTAPVAPTSPSPVVEEKKEQLKQETQQSDKGFKPVYKVELDLTSYAEAMDRSKSIVPEEGGKWQYSLFNTIKSVFAAKSQEEFNAEFNTILNFFNKNKEGIFNEKFIYRFPEHWSGSENEFTLHRRLVYLIIQTADPKGRKKALENINLEVVATGLTEDQKQKLFNFYL